MGDKKKLVSDQRRYLVRTVADAKRITIGWLRDAGLARAVVLGLPEVDDRYHVWRIPLCQEHTGEKVGEVVVDAYSTGVIGEKTTSVAVIEARLLKRKPETAGIRDSKPNSRQYRVSGLRNTVGLGDCRTLMDEMPSESVDLIFTSPPYFNARPEYSEYEQYEEYLRFLKEVIRSCHRVLVEGRFIVINCSPVLIRRTSRSQSSKRIAVPFDIHKVLIDTGFEFVDDILWVKPEGAGWATGRGRRFAADRNPLQYKTVPVTENVLVYRKSSALLIDWFIRNHPDRDIVANSKIGDDYERTNIWRIQPSTNSKHPAAFPIELAERVIKYYSFIGDVVMDPLAGSGTVGAAAAKLGRRFVLYDNNEDYVKLIRDSIGTWLGREANNVLWKNCEPAPQVLALFESSEGYDDAKTTKE